MNAALLIIALLALAFVFVVLPTALDLLRRFRGPRVVVCPKTQLPTEVALDAGTAALTGALTGKSALRIESCERLRDRHTCDEACLKGVDDTTAAKHAILTRSTSAPR